MICMLADAVRHVNTTDAIEKLTMAVSLISPLATDPIVGERARAIYTSYLRACDACGSPCDEGLLAPLRTVFPDTEGETRLNATDAG
jgi:hypothetical protein